MLVSVHNFPYLPGALILISDSQSAERNLVERMKSTTRAMHETINKKSKEYCCLKSKWTHMRGKYTAAYGAVENVVQWKIRKEGALSRSITMIEFDTGKMISPWVLGIACSLVDCFNEFDKNVVILPGGLEFLRDVMFSR